MEAEERRRLTLMSHSWHHQQLGDLNRQRQAQPPMLLSPKATNIATLRGYFHLFVAILHFLNAKFLYYVF
ncbi:hypothetical protein Q3G72_021341 [Acer saccharum]|nr:hypothetical protein Q3G72_021341 [Acer saccharum]